MKDKLLTFDALEKRSETSAEQAGSINTWKCAACRRSITCILRNSGTTPFVIRCDCGKDMKSQFGHPPHQNITEEWYRPKTEKDVLATLPDGYIEKLRIRYKEAGYSLPAKGLTYGVERDLLQHWQSGGLFRRPMLADESTVRLADMKFMDAKILCMYPFCHSSARPNGKCEHWEKEE